MKERLLAFYKHLGLSQNGFEDSCGLSRGTISNLNNGMRSDKLAQIAEKYPELNLRWLLLGEGEMMLRNPNTQPVRMVENAQAVFIANWSDIEPVMEKVVVKVLGGK